MTVPGKFFLAQAESCARAASDSTLPNRREAFLRAEAAWQALADRETAKDAARQEREAGALEPS